MYKEQDGCWNCEHIRVMKNGHEGSEGKVFFNTLYCFAGKKKPECFVCTAQNEFEENKDCSRECLERMKDYFDDYVESYGICENWADVFKSEQFKIEFENGYQGNIQKLTEAAKVYLNTKEKRDV